MEHKIHALHSLHAGVEISDISLDKVYLIQEFDNIFSFSGQKIIQDSDIMSLLHQIFNQVGTDESSSSCDQVFAFQFMLTAPYYKALSQNADE